MAGEMKTRDQTKRSPLIPLLSLLCFVSLFLCLSLFRRTNSSISTNEQGRIFVKPVVEFAQSERCDYTHGSWIYDSENSTPRYDQTCKEIFKGWNCALGGKSNAYEIPNWKWVPRGNGCGLLRFDVPSFLETYRDTSIGFVGDSLNRNMFVSLFCTLKHFTKEVKKWRPAKSDRGFTFLKYNLTIAYHRTNLLVRYGRWTADIKGGELESLGYKEGYRVDVDIPDTSWVEATSFHDVLIFNTGHWWWAPAKFDPITSPMFFFEKGNPVIPPIAPPVGLDKSLTNMISVIEKNMKPTGIAFFRTQSPRHFEGGDWDDGGSCSRVHPLSHNQAEEFFAIESNGINAESRMVNQHLFKAVNGSKFHILDITPMSELRADAHPSIAGGKKHEDCMHWCLPGLADTWNDLFVRNLNRIKFQN